MTVSVALVGAGNRGRYVFGAYALRNPERMRVVALAEPREDRRNATAAEHRLTPDRVFADWREMLASTHGAQAAVIATSDTEHVEPTLAAISFTRA